MYSYVGDVSLLSGVEDIDNSSLSTRPKMFDNTARPYFIAFEDTFKKLPSCGVGGPQSQVAEVEKILNCNPDIIISEYEDNDKANKLQEDLNIPVIVVSVGADGVFDTKAQTTIKLLGEIFNKTEKANKLIDFITSEQKAIEDRVKNINNAEQKKVYICGLGNWGTTDYLQTAQNYKAFKVANINNIINDLPKDGIQKIDKEKFEDIAPNIDIMIIDAAAIKNIKTLYKEDPTIFDNCKAWQNNEVYVELPYNAYYTNLEIALCNTWFNAKVVYPDLFSDFDIETKLNEITKAFLGIELKDKIYNYAFKYEKLNKDVITK